MLVLDGPKEACWHGAFAGKKGPLDESALPRPATGPSSLVWFDDGLWASRRKGAAARLDGGEMNHHTGTMVQKIGITLDHQTVSDLDRWVRAGRYANRSRALQVAAELLIEKEKRGNLARELAKLDPKAEQRLAEEGLGDEAWPEY